ncbi:radical SAM protein [Actinosynnema sp. NPDC050436]|uniref:radical SAM protein n=1 Tax=Actinosynnema sp. NPDC050436 TaxID=3155659 RepID=UPI0033E7FC77
MKHPVMSAARTDNQRLNIEEFDKRETALRSRPLALFVELTQNCNLECPSCRSATKFRPDWNMPPEVFDRVADELFDTALLVDLRGWGESTILKGFPHAVDRVLASGARLRLVTNGQVNNRSVWDRMMAANSQVVLSCDAASQDLFSKLRSGGTLERLRRTAGDLVRFRDEHGADPHGLSLYVVVSRPNLDELPDIVALADDLGIRQVTFAPIQIGLDHPWHLSHDLDGVRRALDLSTARARELGVRLQLASSLDVELNLDDDVKQMCMHPWAYAYISYQGRVGFCDHLIGMTKYTFGSLTESSFEDIWNSEGFRHLRHSHAQDALGDEFSACRWCYLQRYVDFEDEIHPEYRRHVVSTDTRTVLWANGGGSCARQTFLGDDQAETPESRVLLPLTVKSSGVGRA